MTILMKYLDEIREELNRRTLADIPGYANRAVSIRRAIHELAPTLLEKKEAGFKTADLVAMLKDLQITIKAPTLTRYLKEYKEEQKKTQPAPSKSKLADAVPKKSKSPSAPKKAKADGAPTGQAPTATVMESDNEVISGSPQNCEDKDSIKS